MSGLLVLTAIIHFLAGALMPASELRTGLLVFGGVFLAAGIYARRPGRMPVFFAMVASAVGLLVGGGKYLSEGGPISLPLMFMIDVLVIAAGFWWLQLSRHKQ